MVLLLCVMSCVFFFFFKQKTAYEIKECDWSSDVCSSDLLEQLSASERIDEIIVVVSKFNIDLCREKVVKKYNIPKVKHIISGGITRGESVYNGLRKADPQTDIILIHDGVRPFVSKSTINNSIDAAIDSGAVICAVPVISTVKQVKEDHLVEKTIDRKNLVMVQTPQVFKKDRKSVV